MTLHLSPTKITVVMETKSLNRKWLVLCTAFYGNFCSVGLIWNMSVLYVEWLEAFGQSAAETSLIQSLSQGIFSVSGVILGMLLSRFDVRVVGIVSGLLLALGFILSFFSPNLIYLIFILSIPAGIGSSGVYLSSMTAVQQYFDGKQKQISLSIASLGSGVGGTVFTYLLNYLSIQYGWKGCMLIMGGILLHSVPFFAICRPLNKKTAVNTKTKIYSKDIEGNTRGYMHQLKSLLLDFKEIIKNKLFLINLLGIIILPALAAAFIVMIDYLQEKGFSRDDAVLSYMVMSIFNSLSRIAPALLKCIPHMSIFGIALLLSALGTATLLAMPSVHLFSWIIVEMCCMGFCYGAVVGGILPLTVSKIVCEQHFSHALGITLTGFGIVLILVGPFHGYLRDITGSYDAVLYATGSYGCLSILMYIIALGLNRKHGQLKTTNSDNIKPSEKEKASTTSDDRKQPDEDKTATDHVYENFSFETHL